MTFLILLEIINYGLVLIFGLFLSTFISGGWENQTQKKLIFILCPLSLMIQGFFLLFWEVNIGKQLYPFIVHLPLVLILIFALKKKVSIAVISVCTAYLCCQLPRWVQLMVLALTDSPLIGKISYTLSIFPIFFLLHQYFTKAAHDAMTYSTHSMLLFGSLPFAYYLFDYATTVYSNVLHLNFQILNEFFPTVFILFYVMFVTAYHTQEQKRNQIEHQSSMLEVELKQSAIEMESLRHAETQAAIYRHDMRHHLTLIKGFLSENKPQQAMEYVNTLQADVDSITPKKFCEHHLINLLCSSFSEKAEDIGIRLTIKAKLPKTISIPDTELCSLVSNGLENALHAVSLLAESQRWIDFYCEVKGNKLLIEIKNPYTGKLIMQNGLPVSKQKEHGYGCRSIHAISELHQGLCNFETENEIFTLRIILLLQNRPKV